MERLSLLETVRYTSSSFYPLIPRKRVIDLRFNVYFSLPIHMGVGGIDEDRFFQEIQRQRGGSSSHMKCPVYGFVFVG